MILAAARALIALLIAVSLTLTPLTAARARHAMTGSYGMVMAGSHKPDCHKAKQQHRGAPAGHCCCGDRTKSQCPDVGCGCALNCAAQTLAVFEVQQALQMVSASEFHALSAAQPPGLGLVPPGRPPRV